MSIHEGTGGRHGRRPRAYARWAGAAILAGVVALGGCAAPPASGPLVRPAPIAVGAASTDPVRSAADFLASMRDYPAIVRSPVGPAIPGLHGAYGLRRAARGGYDLARSEHFTPQGLAVADDRIFISAYDRQRRLNSVVFVLDRHGRFLKTVALDSRSHVGGLGYDRERRLLWVAESRDGRAAVSAISRDRIDGFDIARRVPIVPATGFVLDSIEDASTLAFADGMLWVGNFTNDAARSTIQVFSAGGERGRATPRSIGDATRAHRDGAGACHASADLAFAAPPAVQGLAFDRGRLFVARSFGVEVSRLAPGTTSRSAPARCGSATVTRSSSRRTSSRSRRSATAVPTASSRSSRARSPPIAPRSRRSSTGWSRSRGPSSTGSPWSSSSHRCSSRSRCPGP